MWHNVITASGIKVRYNPLIQIVALKFAKGASMRLIRLSDSYVIMVTLSARKENLNHLTPPTRWKTPLNPPLNENREWLSVEDILSSSKVEG